jgi:thymidylate synthase (FAD)
LVFYTQWYWKIDLHNLMHFLSLRADPHAQYEIRAYAEVMLITLQRWVPMAYTGLSRISDECRGDFCDRARRDPPAARW